MKTAMFFEYSTIRDKILIILRGVFKKWQKKANLKKLVDDPKRKLASAMVSLPNAIAREGELMARFQANYIVKSQEGKENKFYVVLSTNRSRAN